jgi:hypothetical protein
MCGWIRFGKAMPPAWFGRALAGSCGAAPVDTGRRLTASGGVPAGPVAQGRAAEPFIRASIRSATRSEFAMMVSVGFTAPIEGKKPASVT